MHSISEQNQQNALQQCKDAYQHGKKKNIKKEREKSTEVKHHKQQKDSPATENFENENQIPDPLLKTLKIQSFFLQTLDFWGNLTIEMSDPAKSSMNSQILTTIQSKKSSKIFIVCEFPNSTRSTRTHHCQAKENQRFKKTCQGRNVDGRQNLYSPLGFI